MGVKFSGKNTVLSSFDILLKKDEQAELSFDFNDWKVLIAIVFIEDEELEKPRFSWKLQNIKPEDFDAFSIDESLIDEDDLKNGIDRPLLTFTNWNKPNILYEPTKAIGEHDDSGELRVRTSTKFKDGLYHTHLMFYSCKQEVKDTDTSSDDSSM